MHRTAQLHPTAIAIDVPPSVYEPNRVLVSYQELDQQTHELAQRFPSLIGQDSCIAIYLNRNSHHLYVAQLAVMRAGAAYVCIDPTFPPERVEFILRDARPVAIVTEPELRDTLTPFLSEEIVFDVQI